MFYISVFEQISSNQGVSIVKPVPGVPLLNQKPGFDEEFAIARHFPNPKEGQVFSVRSTNQKDRGSAFTVQFRPSKVVMSSFEDFWDSYVPVRLLPTEPGAFQVQRLVMVHCLSATA